MSAALTSSSRSSARFGHRSGCETQFSTSGTAFRATFSCSFESTAAQEPLVRTCIRDPRRQPAMINVHFSAGLKRHPGCCVLHNCTARLSCLDYAKISLRFSDLVHDSGEHCGWANRTRRVGAVCAVSPSTLLISLSLAEMSYEGIMVSFARLRRRRSYCSHDYHTTKASFAGFLCQ
jgi:hypothetical protein